MFVLVLAAEADETRQAITFLIVCLVGIAMLLAALTVWYWQFTSPERRADALLADLGHFGQPPPPGPHQVMLAPATTPPMPPVAEVGALPQPTPPSESVPLEPDRAGGPTSVPNVLVGSTSEPAASARIEVAERADATLSIDASAWFEAVDQIDVAERPVVESDDADSVAESDAAPNPTVGCSSYAGAGSDQWPAHQNPVCRSGRITVDRAVDRTAKLQDAPPAGRHREPSHEALSDDDWAAVMKSAFDHLRS